MATDTDAARERVLARARVRRSRTELEVLEASGRAAVDIPAKIKRSPAKAAAVAGGVGFLALKGPQRLFRGAGGSSRGTDQPLPKAMLPEEIEKSLRKLGTDGDKVRGTLERDFADYAKQAAGSGDGQRTLLLLTLARPLLTRASTRPPDWLFSRTRRASSAARGRSASGSRAVESRAGRACDPGRRRRRPDRRRRADAAGTTDAR